MRKTVTLLLLALCFSASFAQNKELRQVIVVMEKQYDNVELNRKTQFMNKAQRREFVINDHKAFCQASQAEVLDFVGNLGD